MTQEYNYANHSFLANETEITGVLPDTPVVLPKSTYKLRELSRMRRKQEVIINNEENFLTILCCEACHSKPLIPYDGYMVCNNCGLCQSRDIDSTPEWHNHDTTDRGGVDQSRSCLPNNLLMPDSGLGTIIGFTGNKKNTTASYIVRTMNNWKLMNYKESSMLKKFKHITNICRQANINNMIVEEAKIIFFKISNIVSARRSKLIALMATAVILAHTINGYNRDISDIAQIFALDIRILRKMVKEYERIWKDIVEKEGAEQVDLAAKSIIANNGGQDESSADKNIVQEVVKDNEEIINDDNKRLRKYLIDIGIESIYYDDIYEINKWIIENKVLISHIPKSRFACVIYLVDQIYELGLDKNVIAQKCNTSLITISKCYARIVPHYEIIKTLLV